MSPVIAAVDRALGASHLLTYNTDAEGRATSLTSFCGIRLHKEEWGDHVLEDGSDAFWTWPDREVLRCGTCARMWEEEQQAAERQHREVVAGVR